MIKVSDIDARLNSMTCVFTVSSVSRLTFSYRRLVGQIGNEDFGSQGAAIYSPEGIAYRKVVLECGSPENE
jgi:hypothetical protein